MILNKYIDQTIEAAKQSAQQIYGDDYLKLKNILSWNDQENERRESSEKQQEQNTNSRDQNQPVTGTKKQGVVFERSSRSNTTKSKNSKKKLSKKLESIRKYAAQQTNDTIKIHDQKPSTSDTAPKGKETPKTDKSLQSNNQFYSRKDIRRDYDAKLQDSVPEKKDSQPALGEKKLNRTSLIKDDNENPLYDRFVKDLPNSVLCSSETTTSELKKKHPSNLHERLDRLESLMHLALSAPENAFSAHPLFHKLLYKGVPQKLITDWFKTIIQQDIHPRQHPKLFQSKLLQLIEDLLLQSKASEPKKVLLFTGRSGAGKTHLIIKLANMPKFMKNKNIAIASFYPSEENPKSSYTILEPFCKDHNLAYYFLTDIDKVAKYSSKWKQYDHVLIDTPSLEIDAHSLTKDIVSLKEELQLQAETETHYLVNTAINGIAFNDPLAKEISADLITLTHIDQSLKWGQVIQLLANTDYKLRYISSGPAIRGDLLSFVPDKFAYKLLRA